MSEMENVFILEDSKTDTRLLKKILEENGYKVVGTAESGEEAVEKALALKPDVLFVDIIIKGRNMDGIDAAVEIKKHLDVPIVFVTSYSSETLVERALKVSPYAFMLKPIKADQLRVTLDTVKNRVRLERENKELIEQLYQSQKMEAVGQLAGGIAHNFNNILSVMIGNAELFLKSVILEDADTLRIQKIIDSGKRARDLTTKLLAVSRKENIAVRTVPLSDILGDLLEILKGSVTPKISIETDIKEGLPNIDADPNLIIQALLNVCLNARDSMERDGGTLSINAREVTLDREFCRTKSGIEPGRYCLVQIVDTGEGIPEDIRGRIFEPFFTTKGKEKGTGLGLYVTLGIIQNHNGHIDIVSKEGGGPTANVFLPVSEALSSTAKKKSAAGGREGGGETILIVDDEKDFLDVLSETLEMNGYKTLAAGSGGEAVELYEDRYEDIDVVILDLMMPGMDGGDVYHAIRRIASDVKVILCSGYSVEGKVAELMSEGVDAFIQKPFVFPELEKAIAAVLGS